VRSHSITNGIITFDDADAFAAGLTLTSLNHVAAVVNYLQNNDFGSSGVTVAFAATIGGTAHTYVYQQVGNSPSAGNDVLVDLSGITLPNLSTLITNGVVDPIVLDLGHDGIAFSSLSDGVQFDINADGADDQIAWTAGNDGILAFDVDGSGQIENGAEIFSPYFAGGNHASGLAALATLDSNADGKIDSSDVDFDKLLVWQDANHNGTSNQGELTHLADNGITSISLTGTPTDGMLDGQQLVAEGTYQTSDGTTGSFVEVAFDTSLGTPGVVTLTGTDADDTLVGTAKADILIGALAHDTLTGGEGADTFMFAEAGAAQVDTVTDYSFAQGDKLDISALLDGHFGEGANAADFIRLVNTDGNVTLQVDTDGAGANATWADVAVLESYHSVGNQVLVEFEQQAHQLTVAA
jgi:Ca2+-binding RTX toxin-like protein